MNLVAPGGIQISYTRGEQENVSIIGTENSGEPWDFIPMLSEPLHAQGLVPTPDTACCPRIQRAESGQSVRHQIDNQSPQNAHTATVEG